MHRHGYKGRKFGRKSDQRLALRRSLMYALIMNTSITTTLAKAKEIRRDVEKLVTIAKKGGLANRRILIARLNSIEAATVLIDVIAPQIHRESGYLKIERAGLRRGDSAEMATISFVDDIDFDAEVAPAEAEKPAKAETKAAAKAEKAEKAPEVEPESEKEAE